MEAKFDDATILKLLKFFGASKISDKQQMINILYTTAGAKDNFKLRQFNKLINSDKLQIETLTSEQDEKKSIKVGLV